MDTGSERLILNQEHFKPGANGQTVASVGNTGEVTSAIGKQVDSIRLDQLVIREVYAHIIDLHHKMLKGA